MDDPIRKYCLQKGYARHVIEGGIDYLITKWEKIAVRAASGYSLGPDDFLNHMDLRRILAEVVTVATKEQKEAIESRLKKADELFIKSTVESPKCIWGRHNEDEYGYSRERDWFYYRVPVSLYDWFAAES